MMEDLEESILPAVIKTRPAESHKGTFGRVLLVGGNHQFGGAIIMAAAGAVNAGAGLVTVACDPQNITALHANLPEAMAIDFHDAAALTAQVEQANVVVVGPGLGTEPASLAILKTVFQATLGDQTVVIDGSALTLMAKAKLDTPAGKLVLTPHQMEWARLSGLPIADQTEDANRAVADRLQATVVLKKHHTEIYLPKQTYRLTIGNAGQAIGGMGDTLAGIIGAFAAEFADQGDQAILAAVYTHSAVADQLAEQAYIVRPTKLAAALPAFMRHIERLPHEHEIGFFGSIRR